MSIHVIYYEGGAKKMRPILTEEEYRQLRDSEHNKKADKKHMVQMNYSCLPNEDGKLRGSKRISKSVGMDIDFCPDDADYEKKMADVPELILSKKKDLGLLMLERSANKGYHIAFRRKPNLSQEDNLKWAAKLLGVEYDKGAKDITRVFYTPPTDRLLYFDKELLDNTECKIQIQESEISKGDSCNTQKEQKAEDEAVENTSKKSNNSTLEYCGIPYSDIIRKWWQMYNDGHEPVRSNRNTLTFELAVNLRHICGFDRQQLNQVIPCYDGFPETEKLACIDSALGEKRTQMPKRLKDVLAAIRQELLAAKNSDNDEAINALDEANAQDELFYYNSLPTLPQGIRDSINSVGPHLAMPALIAICPVLGCLATGVKVDIHGRKNSLNLISYVAGDFASGKGSIDPLIDAWTCEIKQMDKVYLQQEEDWRAKKRAAKNKKEQPEEPKLPIRILTLNNTVANLADRLSNTEGKHAFSFTPEADTVAQKWRSGLSDFSVMLRQAYDGTSYEREAKSADAVNVHIDRLLWNVTMCGTPDALYRVVSNYTDGFQSRIAVARTPDNTFAALTENLYVLTDVQRDQIFQIAHLLPLMDGDIVLPKLEKKGRDWLEEIRLETMKNDDKTKARQRFRICPSTMRMMTCIMLCKVAEQLIKAHGLAGAEKRLKENPQLWKEMIVKTQTPTMLAVFDVLADYLMENALYFFRERIEAAFSSREYMGQTEKPRVIRGKNDTIFARLDSVFTSEQATQQSIAIKGTNVTKTMVRQMLKNWRKQGLIAQIPDGRFQKILTL
ncbi:DUF3987 domain-containing protein [Prevotella copri]|uniref:DUF3987 domain-containing protein n=1 Tax=Segatella copri TaxID=165179 RepID=UPI001C380233|nr:DUF3987 domain-containing protein [Segatella copri]MBV3415443.1 DUF3987 domain-containing protein [Segatella copri]